jgi:ATP-dependent helicase HrpA
MSTPKTAPRHPPTDPRLQELRDALPRVASRDYGRLLGRVRGLARKPDPARIEQLAQDVAASMARRAARAASKPAITIDASLPIAARADDIIKLIREHQVVVLAGETGSGKTTQLPKLCLAAGRGEAGLIGCTQPRRLAARSVAARVAEELGTPLGDKVGFQVRFTEKVGDNALVKFMTDGILLAETQGDPWLSAYDTIIIDEAHERSLNIDFLLGYLKRLCERRPDLKVIVTSATIDTERFAAHFAGAPVVEVEGRTYPVDVRYRPPGEKGEGNLSLQIADVMDEITREDPRGDVLVFLPGEREIRDAHLALSRRQYRETEVLALYARLSASEQDRVFRPGPKRRIVLATNVAETSLTVPRIRYVVDPGTARVKRYSQRGQLERLHIEPISQAAANQRKGRCGRVGPGICYRLYEEQDFNLRPEFTDPELLRSSLANVILRMLALDLGEVEDFPFLEAPDPRVVADGYRRLAEIGAIDDDRRLTGIGRTVARLPIDVQLARMLVEARRLGSLADLTTVVAFLSIQDPRERPPEARGQADAAHAQFADPKSDFVGVINLWKAYLAAAEDLTSSKLRDWCSRNFLSFMRMREWRELHRQLVLVAREMTWDGGKEPARTAPPEGDALFESIHRSLLAGLPTQVGHKDEKGVFRGTRERRFQVFPGSALAKAPPAWLFSAQILDIGGRVWAMMNARIDPAWVEQQASHLVRATARDAHWSRKRGTVVAYEQVTLFGLVLVERRPVTFHKQDPKLAHDIFLREALVRGELDSKSDFVRANQRVLEQAHDIEAKQRRAGLLRSDDELVAFFDGKLPGSITDTRALDAWYRKASPGEQAALRWTLADVMDTGSGLDPKAFPASITLGQHTYRLEYRFVPGDPADGVTISVPLAFLNAVPAARGEWLVGGLLADKVAELIRGLPKALRRNFVPAPDFARAFVEAESPRDEPLAKALATFLKRTTGVDVDAAAFADAEVPTHLQMRYRVHDEKGRTVTEGRDLAAIRAAWEGKAREAFSRKTDIELTREDILTWDFESIPLEVRSEAGLKAYPALVDLGEAVALRVFERADEAAAAHVQGVERLLRGALAPEFKRARRQLPISNPLSLKYAPLGSVDRLRDDLVEGGFDDLLADAKLNVRTLADFEHLKGEMGRALFGAAMARQKVAEPIIEAQAELKPWMEPPLLGFAKASYDDLREQLAGLMQPGFLRELPTRRLQHIPRYLRAMRLRAERLRQDPQRDQARMLQVLPYWRALLNAGGTALDAAAWAELRWLVEEWRVSLFAQELKTAEPVSAKRLAKALEAAQASNA